MSQHLNIYGQKGCVDCRPCERGGANIGRITVLVIIGIFTCGVGLIFLPFHKKCLYCGHNTWWNKHYGPDLRLSVQAPAAFRK